MQSEGYACGIVSGVSEKLLLRVSSDAANRALLCLFLILPVWLQDGELPCRGNGLFTLFWGCIGLFMPLPFHRGFLWGFFVVAVVF